MTSEELGRLVADMVGMQKRLLETSPNLSMPKRQYINVDDFIAQEGMPFEHAPLPKKVKMGELGYCYMNAYNLATSGKGLIYCEGKAIGRAPIPLDHAWCVTKDGKVVDNTWTEEGAYFGVPISLQVVLSTALTRKIYGVLDAWESGWPIVSGKVPKEQWLHENWQ